MNCPHCKKKIGETGIDLATNHPVFIQRDALLEAAKAYQELAICYRIGKRPTEKLFSRLEKAKTAIAESEPKP